MGQPDQHAIVAQIVLGSVVEVGGFGKEGRAVRPIDAEKQRVGLSRLVRRDAGHHLPMDFKGRSAKGGGLLDTREGESDVESLGEGEGHGEQNSGLTSVKASGPLPERLKQREARIAAGLLCCCAEGASSSMANRQS